MTSEPDFPALYITYAMMLGAELTSTVTVNQCKGRGTTVYGRSPADCALSWLKLRGYNVDDDGTLRVKHAGM